MHGKPTTFRSPDAIRTVPRTAPLCRRYGGITFPVSKFLRHVAYARCPGQHTWQVRRPRQRTCQLSGDGGNGVGVLAEASCAQPGSVERWRSPHGSRGAPRSP